MPLVAALPRAAVVSIGGGTASRPTAPAGAIDATIARQGEGFAPALDRIGLGPEQRPGADLHDHHVGVRGGPLTSPFRAGLGARQKAMGGHEQRSGTSGAERPSRRPTGRKSASGAMTECLAGLAGSPPQLDNPGGVQHEPKSPEQGQTRQVPLARQKKQHTPCNCRCCVLLALC